MITRAHARWILLAIVLATAVLRLAFIEAFLDHVPAKTILKSLTNDTGTYLEITKSLARGCGFLGAERSHVLNRPPGYPLFAFPFHVAGALPRGIVLTQMLLSLFGPWFVYRAAREARCGRGAGLAAAAVLAFSPTNISITAFVIPDSIFATIVTLATWLLVRAWRKGTANAALLAGIALAVGLLVKPALSFWWILAPGLLVFARLVTRRPVRPVALAALALPPLLILLGWSARNHVAEDVFVYSTVGMRTVRFYTGVQIEEWNRLGRFPTLEEERRRRQELY
ncbi:MAG: phospholipid carrier-dependent glycosyltransferase, partial [Gemmatimonadetes bacterium]|nr:phospholipid carrier-dependent glycosyltransferase [Gemmatimonadota bacterium]